MTAPLIHIGYNKAASTWLQKRFFKNPKTGFQWTRKGPGTGVTALASARPLEFSVEKSRAIFAAELESARAKGLMPVVSLERLAGHPFSGGFDSKELAHRLTGVFPGARFLAVFREQKSMIVSTFKQYVKAGGTSSLERFIDPPRHRHVRLPQFDLRHFEYHHILRFYRTLAGEENVLFLPFERFVREPQAFVRDIASFAGVDLSQDVVRDLPFVDRWNASPSAFTIGFFRRCNRMTSWTDVNPNPMFFIPQLDLPLRRVAEWVDGILPKRYVARVERKLRDRVARRVEGFFANSNRALSQLTGLDLTPYGYEVAAGLPEEDAP